MPRVRNWWSQSKTAPLIIWLISALIFYFLFQMALHNSTPLAPSLSGSSISSEEQRTKLYEKMSKDLDENGAVFLKHGETSQSLSISDLFTVKDGVVTPVHRAANPPVRATVMHLASQYSVPIAEAVKSTFLPYFDKATEIEIEAEVNAVQAVAKGLCPLNISLDRVVLTSTGVLLGCWQVNSGTDPVIVRDRLRAALPRAPQKQFYDAAIFHTSFARFLGHPTSLPEGKKSAGVQFFHELVTKLNNKLNGFKATVSELWYVEEYDVLALALDGRINAHKFKLGCFKT